MLDVFRWACNRSQPPLRMHFCRSVLLAACLRLTMDETTASVSPVEHVFPLDFYIFYPIHRFFRIFACFALFSLFFGYDTVFFISCAFWTVHVLTWQAIEVVDIVSFYFSHSADRTNFLMGISRRFQIEFAVVALLSTCILSQWTFERSICSRI